MRHIELSTGNRTYLCLILSNNVSTGTYFPCEREEKGIHEDPEANMLTVCFDIHLNTNPTSTGVCHIRILLTNSLPFFNLVHEKLSEFIHLNLQIICRYVVFTYAGSGAWRKRWSRSKHWENWIHGTF